MLIGPPISRYEKRVAKLRVKTDQSPPSEIPSSPDLFEGDIILQDSLNPKILNKRVSKYQILFIKMINIFKFLIRSVT